MSDTMVANSTGPAYWEYLAQNDLCTTDICPLDYAFLDYLPSVGGNAFYSAWFGLLLIIQLGLGIRYKTWAYTFSMCSGLLLELIGYAGRVLLHNDPYSNGNFLMYIICLTIGPAFFSAAIYLCLARIITIYNPSLSRLSPRAYTITFITADFIALVLQAAGGALADTMDDSTMGTNIMVAGLAWQVFSMFVFICLCADFAWKARNNKTAWNPAHATTRNSLAFKGFLIGLTIATIGIMIRCCFRSAELSEGFDGALANDENTFMVLEGAMVAISCLVLTALHPGPALGDAWKGAGFHLRKSKATTTRNEKAMDVELSEV